MTPDRERAKGIDLPDWWLSLVRDLVDERGTKLGQLGRDLAMAVNRERPWDHGRLSRFLKGENATVELTEAFSELFGVPPPVFYARSLEEATALRAASRRFEEHKLTPEQRRRLAIADRAGDHAELDALDQTEEVSSTNEGTDRSRRLGRVARSRPKAS